MARRGANKTGKGMFGKGMKTFSDGFSMNDFANPRFNSTENGASQK